MIVLLVFVLFVEFLCGYHVKTMVWSGSTDWPDIDSDITALATYLPNTIPISLDALFTYVGSIPDKTVVLDKLEGSDGIILSIGGSEAESSGWKNMEESGTSAWKDLFVELRTETGMNGVDWDLEQLPEKTDATFWTFVSDLTADLRAEGFFVGYTFIGNVDNSELPPDSFFEDADADYYCLMLYDGSSMWENWESYAVSFRTKFPNLVSKMVYGLYPAAPNYSGEFREEFVNNATDLVGYGTGYGIAVWCYGGWLGNCASSAKSSVKTCLEKVYNEEIRDSDSECGVLDYGNDDNNDDDVEDGAVRSTLFSSFLMVVLFL